ncbi:hypothetical protein GPECTOR_82g231 [Gonium pectorale]|uniref:Glycosyl transferase CAP10 domain-containing protein n=1 Tax=Gonium pectorale TaxID=33097 RepID=A0A150G1H9_GONPE|nr:hypothetical protein GPECTOR_82g231 [Gonium pectorale]|eukprot:KXZ43697.1 hypothetical protein GPECTOR_82g231 [Gonium pectorale]
MATTERRRRRLQGALVTIVNGNAFVSVPKRDGFESRLYATLMLLQRAMDRLGRKSFPDVEFGIHTFDYPKHDAFFNYCRPKARRPGTPGNWVWPDFQFYSWPEIGADPWPMLLQKVAQLGRELPFSQRDRRMIWRGSPLAPVRNELLKRFGRRGDVADVAMIRGFKEFWPALRRNPDLNISTMITPLEDFCRYRYIIYTEGKSYSGRLKAHLICGSVILTHPTRWEFFESEVLQEGRNFVTVDPKWDTLEEAYRKLEADPALAEGIASENAKMRELLDADGVSCFILESLKCFKDVMKYNVTQPANIFRHTPLEFFFLAKMKPGGHLEHIRV